MTELLNVPVSIFIFNCFKIKYIGIQLLYNTLLGVDIV